MRDMSDVRQAFAASYTLYTIIRAWSRHGSLQLSLVMFSDRPHLLILLIVVGIATN